MLAPRTVDRCGEVVDEMPAGPTCHHQNTRENSEEASNSQNPVTDDGLLRSTAWKSAEPIIILYSKYL